MQQRGQIRIIGGRWKSRRVRCASPSRPSPDAVRETLFNWLPHDLAGKTCLDLFAGSGALGFEAASRGAASVVMVESHPRAVDLLRANSDALRADDAVEIFAGTVERFIRRHAERGFDILFMDPPFGDGAIEATCRDAQKLLNPRALVYIESQVDGRLPVPPDWVTIRQNRCGAVQSTLIQT